MAAARILWKGVSITAAALAGNWLGGQIRSLLTGQEAQSLRFHFVNEQGKEISNFPVATKFYPAVGAAGIGKPRWLYALLGGVLAGVVIDDRYERCLWERMDKLSLMKASLTGQHQTSERER